ncbi:MAG TPA: long-chain fatty acid--CoA ligase, partial [Actinopolymorphaceae bacterium]
LLAKIASNRDQLSDLVAVVTFDGTPDPDAPVPVLSLAELEKRGSEHLAAHPDAIEQAMAAIGPDSLATLIYTSGTTGKPKGVRLVHDCWTYEGACIDAVNLLTPEHFQFLWLPLSHSFGKVLLSAQLQIGFSTAVDGRVDKIIDNLGVVKPVWMCAAPRIFEKAYSRIVTGIEQEGGIKARLFDWAFGVGKQVSRLRQEGKEPTGLLALQHKLADTLVFSKIRERFGGNLKFMVSGSAGLNKDIAEWFHAAGMLILEGYGLTETSAATCVNLPGIFRFGTVGPPFPGTELRIADDGEVLVKGPGVMRGYHNRPEQTTEVLDEDGWFRTGDIGELTDEGLLRITDRKKDLFKTSGGKYVAPSVIESMFKSICPYASQIVVHGENRKFVSALITLDPDAVASWSEHEGVTGRSYAELVSSDYARQRVQAAIDELNAKLNRWETIKKFVILDHDLSVEDGDMTPSLKVKRRAVEARYADVLEALYA